jgi:hypothetical protein
MSLLNINNKDAKHLLPKTEDGIFTTSETLTWEDIREVGWDKTSVTEDMRRMNAERLIDEIRTEMSRAVQPLRNTGRSITAHVTASNAADEILRHYQEMGAINYYTIEHDMDMREGNIRLDIRIQPRAAIETINMNVQLSI